MSELETMANEEISIDNLQERDSSKRNNSGDDFPENVGRSFKEIGKRIKRKSGRPPLSPDNEVPDNQEDYLSDDDTQMGFTKNQSTENETTENPPAKEDVVEKIKRTEPYRKTGFTEKQATENEPTANPATEEVAEKIKKTKFCRKYLVIGKESWNQNASEFFRGSQIFLTLFYVDRVMHKGITFVDRKFPTYRGWTEEILKERQAIEKPATSGRNDGPQKKNVDDDNLYCQEPSAGRNESFDNDNMDINNPAGDDWYECQQDYQGNVYDDYCQNNQGTDNANDDGSWVQNRQANEEDAENGQWHAWPSHEKDDLSNGMKSSERCFTNNDDVENVIIEDEFCKEDEFCEEDIIEMPEKVLKNLVILASLMIVKEVFNEVFSAKNGDEGTKDASSNFNEKRKEDVTPDANNPVDDQANNPVDDQAAIDEDIIAYLHSEEGIKEMATLSYREKRELASVPSFSLGPEIEILSQLGY
ncbi:hypothetical protein POM88_029731 [Heracleum sosnowskyi]|uniref:Uncharacterized protein n=1 Tax=Heracleum sosnowskyi TaxID=360622 RepID=A0AAD8HV94_9APIA|nr:hypothetical protein POM88_029731 [Heracleum sosnowskyi]